MPASAGEIYAAAGRNIASNISDAIERYQKIKEQHDQQDALWKVYKNLQVPAQDGSTNTDGTPKMVPAANKAFVEAYERLNAREKGSLHGQGLILHQLQGALNAVQEAASPQGQRSLQLLKQANQAFPLEQQQRQMALQKGQQDVRAFPVEQQQRQLNVQRTQQIVDNDNKVMVPGYGLMTPTQLSAHNNRQARLAELQKKLEPATKFETALQTDYGVGTKDIIDAANSTFTGKDLKDPSKTNTYTGVPFVTASGGRVTVANGEFKDQQGNKIDYSPKSPTVFAQLPTGALVPADKWPTIVAQAKGFDKQANQIGEQQSNLQQQNTQLQAQQIISANQGKDPSTLTPQDQQAIQWAKDQLGQ